MEGGMTDRRDDWQKRTEDDERRREERERRYEELREAWRRNHPGEQEEAEKGRPKKGRPA